MGKKFLVSAFLATSVFTATLLALAPQFGHATPIGGNSVTVTSVTPGTTATKIGKTEDAGHASGDAGVMSLGVQSTDLGALAGTTADYAPFQVDGNGALYTTLYSDGSPVAQYTASVTATGSVDAGVNRIYMINYCNADATDRHYLKIYDKATAATESDTPVYKTGADGLECHTVSIPGGLPIALGISLRATAENADNGTTAASANESAVTLLIAD